MQPKNKLSIEEQLKKASAAVSPKGGGNYKEIIRTEKGSVPIPSVQETPKVPIPPTIAQQEEKQEETVPTFRELKQQSAPVYKAPEKIEKPVYKAPDVVNDGYFAGLSQSKRHDIPHVEFIGMIVSVSDLYRNFDPTVQNTIKQFIKVGRDLTSKPADIALIIEGLLKVRQEEQEGLADLVNLKEEERPSRAFSLMALSDNRLQHLHDLVTLFNSRYLPQTNLLNDRIVFCRELEVGIETLDPKILLHLKPINQLLEVVSTGK